MDDCSAGSEINTRRGKGGGRGVTARKGDMESGREAGGNGAQMGGIEGGKKERAL